MDDDALNRGQPDRFIVSFEEQELRYWAATLGVSREALNSAIKAVGSEPYKVRQYLAKQNAYALHS